RYGDAEPLYRRSLAIWTKVLGPEHPMLATSFDNLAVVCASQQKLREAEALYRKALEIRDTEDAGSLRNLALVEVAQEQWKAAEPLLKRALLILDTLEPADPPALIATLNDYAEVLEKTGRNVRAGPIRKRAKALEASQKKASKGKTK
ncbi:MAG: tetratricopeptide repeat protein, partial [Bryobacteraceae bacterium]